MNKTKTPLLWAIFIAVTFFSCYDYSVGTQGYKVEENTLSFIKFNLVSYSKEWINTTIIGGRIEINECMVGDTIGLTCMVGYSVASGIYPESVTAIISTSRGDMEFIELLDTPDIAYLAIVRPPSPHLYSAYLPNEDMYPNLPEPFLLSHIPIKYESKSKVRNGILSVSPDGDIITAEIINGCQSQKTILTVRSK
jgi:hypothetical protein